MQVYAAQKKERMRELQVPYSSVFSLESQLVFDTCTWGMLLFIFIIFCRSNCMRANNISKPL